MIPAAWVSGMGNPAASGSGDTQTVTTGTTGAAPNRSRGRSTINGIGSISDGTSNLYSGAAITEFRWDEDGGSSMFYSLAITGATNSGWTSVVIGGTKTLNRIDASFSGGEWIWSTTDTVSTQAFGSAGSVKVCVFT
jgi:hypothetical protein